MDEDATEPLNNEENANADGTDDDDEAATEPLNNEQPSTQVEATVLRYLHLLHCIIVSISRFLNVPCLITQSSVSPRKNYKRPADRGASPRAAKKKPGHAAVVEPSAHAQAPALAKNTRPKARLLPNPARNTRSKSLKF